MNLLRAMWGELAIVLVVILGLTLSAYAAPAIGRKPRPNSLGVEQTLSNQNIYLYGSVNCHGSACGIVERGKRLATNVTFNPAHAPFFLTESVLFCGNESKSFEGLSGPLVITYERVAHEMLDGIACHDLVSVDKVEAKKEIQWQ